MESDDAQMSVLTDGRAPLIAVRVFLWIGSCAERVFGMEENAVLRCQRRQVVPARLKHDRQGYSKGLHVRRARLTQPAMVVGTQKFQLHRSHAMRNAVRLQ